RNAGHALDQIQRKAFTSEQHVGKTFQRGEHSSLFDLVAVLVVRLDLRNFRIEMYKHALGNLESAYDEIFLRQKASHGTHFTPHSRLPRDVPAANVLGQKFTDRRHDSPTFKPVHTLWSRRIDFYIRIVDVSARFAILLLSWKQRPRFIERSYDQVFVIEPNLVISIDEPALRLLNNECLEQRYVHASE